MNKSVYVMQSEIGLVKLGIADDPAARLRNIQGTSGIRLARKVEKMTAIDEKLRGPNSQPINPRGSVFKKLAVVRYFQNKPACAAFHEVRTVVTVNGTERRSCFITDPATGALIVNPIHHREIEKAFRRELRRIYLRLKLRILLLQINYLFLSTKCLALKARAFVLCGLREGF